MLIGSLRCGHLTNSRNPSIILIDLSFSCFFHYVAPEGVDNGTEQKEMVDKNQTKIICAVCNKEFLTQELYVVTNVKKHSVPKQTLINKHMR